MIDRPKRELLIRSLRSLLDNTINNLEYDDIELDGKLESEDYAVFAIWMQTWFMYDDYKAHKIILTKEQKELMARCVLFLYSDLEFEASSRGVSLSGCLLNLLTFISFGLFTWRPKHVPKEEDYIWPFFRQEDFEREKQKELFLYRDWDKNHFNEVKFSEPRPIEFISFKKEKIYSPTLTIIFWVVVLIVFYCLFRGLAF